MIQIVFLLTPILFICNQIQRRKIQVISHGIDQKRNIIGCGSCREVVIAKNERIVTYFGLVRKGKGLEDLVRAWRKANTTNAKLLIIGGRHPTFRDNCYENLVNLIKEMGLEESVRFVGFVSDEALPAYFSKTDAFVLPYNEWGDVIASSGALSFVAPYLKPIIATDVPAFFELKSLRAALIVKRGDIDGMAFAIARALTDDKLKETLIANLA